MKATAALVARCGILLLVVVALVAPEPPARASASFLKHDASNTQREDRPNIAKRLQRTLERSRATTVAPGAQAVLVRNGKLVWTGTDGLAVRRPRRRVSDKTLFCYASFGKMVLSSFTLHQVEAGVVELDEPIRSYVGRSIPGSRRVSIRMLLNHTAGYPDIYSHPKIAPLFGGRYDPNRKWTFRKLFRGLLRPRDPGARWEYSNTGYLVLAYVLREVTKRPLPRAVGKFLAPAGVVAPTGKSSITMRRARKAARKMAHGFVFDNDPPSDTFIGAKSIPTDLFGMPWGDGLFSGTALGAAKFLDTLLVKDALLDAHTLEVMTTPSEEALKKQARYGLGTERMKAAKRRWQGHAGAYGGFSSMGYTNLKSRVTLVVVANGYGGPGPLPADMIWRDLARAYFGEDR